MYHTPSAVNVFSYAALESRVRGVQFTGHLSVFFGTDTIAKPLPLGKNAQRAAWHADPADDQALRSARFAR